MNGYYGTQYAGQQLATSSHANSEIGQGVGVNFDGSNSAALFRDGSMEADGSAGKARRRQSFPTEQAYAATQSQASSASRMDGHMRRGSMVEFGAAQPTAAMANFQFAPVTNQDAMMSMVTAYQGVPGGVQARPSLGLSTQYDSHDSGYGNMVTPGSGLQSPMVHASPLVHQSPMDMEMNNALMAQSMGMQMDFNDSGMNIFDGTGASLQMFPHNHFNNSMMDAAMNSNYSTPLVTNSSNDPTDQHDEKNVQEGDAGAQSLNNSTPNTGSQSMMSAPHDSSIQEQSPAQGIQGGMQFDNSASGQQNMSNDQMTQNKFQWPNAQGNYQTVLPQRPHSSTKYNNAYSSTGFDMLTVLMRVATRKNPEINIGAVDLSCSFVVCDVMQHDVPIVYCSENFERLTGYTKHEILGRNCRFLQAPDGRVQAGVTRKYVDDDSVLYLKNMISARREAQISLINYRKGGQPFMNLLTMIPIPYDTDEIKFIVGFQVDLVEQPNSVTNKNPDGSYTINYQRGLSLPRYTLPTPVANQGKLESGQTITRDDVSVVLSSIGTEESELSKRIWDKVLLENTDDIVHVLSLKGLFMYLSPSCKKVLEYDSHELVGTALSSVCHPSDIVPVTRELKDTSATSSVNIVYRIRRKFSGYMWFEGHGALHTDQGKGRKCIILVGRERPVYTLSKSDIDAVGGIGDNELWSKLSTSGMFLYVSSNVRSLLDRQGEELVGTSIQALMRQESKQEFGRILEIVRTGKKASVKHELFNKRGQTLQAFSTIYPGDAAEGAKPTFMVAQTRLVKFSRSHPQPKGRATPLSKYELQSDVSMTSNQSNHGYRDVNGSSRSPYVSNYDGPTTMSGVDGLAIGHQDIALASEDNVFDELKTTRSTSWQFELRQMEKSNRLLAEEVQSLLAQKKKRKRRKGAGHIEKDCANCHTKVTPEWRRGPSGNRDLCNSCGLRWAKQQGRVSPRTSSQRSVHSTNSDKASGSPNTAKANANAKAAIAETANDATGRSTSPRQGGNDDHVSKAVKTGPAGREHQGSGRPPKIEEASEPD